MRLLYIIVKGSFLKKSKVSTRNKYIVKITVVIASSQDSNMIDLQHIRICCRESRFFISHLNLTVRREWRRRHFVAAMSIAQKNRMTGYEVTKNVWWYARTFRHNTISVWQTDRRTKSLSTDAHQSGLVTQWLFDFDSTPVRRPFVCFSKVSKVTVT